MIDRILDSVEFLIRLSKATPQQYNTLIAQAKPEQIRSILECVRMCDGNKIVKDRKTLRKLKRSLNIESAILIFKKNQKAIRAIIVFVLLRIIGLAINHVICSCDD